MHADHLATLALALIIAGFFSMLINGYIAAFFDTLGMLCIALAIAHDFTGE